MTDKTVSAATLKHLADLKTAESRKRKLAVGIGGGVIVAALAIVGTVYALHPSKVTASSDKKQIAALVASDKFESLPTAEKKELREALVSEGKGWRDLEPEARRNLGESRMDEQVEKYFSLPLGKERDAELDKQLDEMQKRMSQWQSRAATRPATRPAGDGARADRGGDRQPRDRNAASARRDSGDPAKRAERVEYRAALQARAEARGIKMPGGGGPGGGGWGGGRGR